MLYYFILVVLNVNMIYIIDYTDTELFNIN